MFGGRPRLRVPRGASHCRERQAAHISGGSPTTSQAWAQRSQVSRQWSNLTRPKRARTYFLAPGPLAHTQPKHFVVQEPSLYCSARKLSPQSVQVARRVSMARPVSALFMSTI